MTQAMVIMLSLFLFASHVESSRIRKQVNIQQHDEKEASTGKCSRWCKKMDWWTLSGCNGDMAAIQEEANKNCVHKQCSGCEGGGTTPDCRPPADEEETAEEQSAQEEEVQDAEPADADDIPFCLSKSAVLAKVCRVKKAGLEGKICSYAETAWCMPPSINPGHRYRRHGKPLCCNDEQESNTDDGLDEEIKKVEETVKDHEKEPEKPVPLCPEGDKYEVDSFQRRGKTVHVCRDSTSGLFAKKACCDPKTFEMLEEKAKASEACAQVDLKYCNDRKSKKWPKDMPKTFRCVKKYMCTERGNEAVGPVPSQSYCLASKTGLAKNRPAKSVCVEVKK